MLATEYAGYFNIPPQSEGESDSVFRDRVSGALRAAGYVIEAHEVAQNTRYDADDGDMVLAGILGAVSMAYRGKNYGQAGSTLVGDEIAAGVIEQSPEKPRMSALEIEILLALRGKE